MPHTFRRGRQASKLKRHAGSLSPDTLSDFQMQQMTRPPARLLSSKMRMQLQSPSGGCSRRRCARHGHGPSSFPGSGRIRPAARATSQETPACSQPSASRSVLELPRELASCYGSDACSASASRCSLWSNAESCLPHVPRLAHSCCCRVFQVCQQPSCFDVQSPSHAITAK